VSNVVLRLPSGAELPCTVDVQTHLDYETVTGPVRVPRTVKDKAGHEHHWADSGWPSTVREAVEPCDGACGDPEHLDVVYRCTQCQQAVAVPTTVRTQRISTGGTVTYKIESSVECSADMIEVLCLALDAGSDMTLIARQGTARVEYPLTNVVGPLDLISHRGKFGSWAMRHTEQRVCLARR
jgi:hypothetical protein